MPVNDIFRAGVVGAGGSFVVNEKVSLLAIISSPGVTTAIDFTISRLAD